MWAVYVYCFGVRRALLAMTATACVFVMTFVPYLPDGLDGIVHNVFAYAGMQGRYGFTLFMSPRLVTLVDLALLLLLPVLVRKYVSLFWTLAFSTIVTFAFLPAYGIHYSTLVLTMAVLTAITRKWLVLFSAIVLVAGLTIFPITFNRSGEAAIFEGFAVLILWTISLIWCGAMVVNLFRLRLRSR